MDVAIIIPAQASNKYNESGDLASFGDTTLLEWKISQCKEIVDQRNIYISSSDLEVKKIAFKEEVNFIQRNNETSFSQIILHTLQQVPNSNILWTNPTAPFISKDDYSNMLKTFFDSSHISSLISVSTKKDYVYYQNKRLNFDEQFISRDKIPPVKVVTNGCYLIEKNLAIATKSLYSNNPFLYELDYLSALEIKDLHTYQISQELISAYFKRDLHV